MGATNVFFEITNKIEELLTNLNEKVIGREINRKDILVNSVFPLYVAGIGDHFFFHEVDSDYVPEGTIDYAGRFDAMDKSIHIEIIHHPGDKTYRWNAPLWGYIRTIYFDTIAHEIVHLYQNDMREMVGIADSQRNPSNKEFKCIGEEDEAENGLYLVKPDEVEAYAYNFACQLFRRYRSVDAALQALRTGIFNDIETYNYYEHYIKKNSYIFKRLLKKTTYYLLNKYSQETYNIPVEAQENVTSNKK